MSYSKGWGQVPDRQATVLVVDDDHDVCRALALALALEDHRVVAAGSAEAALTACVADPPDVVLLDVMLPGMSGLDLLTRFKFDPSMADVPVLLISARGGQTAVDGLQGGAFDYIGKPFDLGEVAARVGVALATKRTRDGLAQRIDALEQLSLTDDLTGVDNRRAAERALDRLAAGARRSGQPLSVLLVDIDHFKAVNDTYGHAMGDRVLAHVATRLASAMRAGDTLARWGGEEFLVVMPDTDLAGACEVAERLRHAVAADPPLADAPAVTVSIGAAIGHQPDQLLADADAAMYAAKATGRNRVAPRPDKRGEAASTTTDPTSPA